MRADAVKQKTGFGRIIGKVLLYFLTFLLVILIGLVGAVAMIDLGPSPAVRDLFVVTVTQTSAGGFLASMFLDEATIAEIIEKNSVAGSDEITDGDNVVIGGGDENYDLDKIEVFDVTGPTYKGKMMVVNDPSRVFVGSIPDYTVERGNTVQEIVAMYDGVAGVNGGGFEDIAGRGKGATPLGLVISQGEWLNGYAGQSYYHVVGFNQEDKLVVG
ncbi:MAG: phosphodiester glycosidase family protein, partial [Firmicutes bacterium]|nr:phosphodiester glycosidase family protein [Bacillota bacterium]